MLIISCSKPPVTEVNSYHCLQDQNPSLSSWVQHLSTTPSSLYWSLDPLIYLCCDNWGITAGVDGFTDDKQVINQQRSCWCSRGFGQRTNFDLFPVASLPHFHHQSWGLSDVHLLTWDSDQIILYSDHFLCLRCSPITLGEFRFLFQDYYIQRMIRQMYHLDNFTFSFISDF